MKPVLSSSAMREADRVTIEELGIPGFTLMELAGAAAARVVLEQYGGGVHYGVLCGRGNNAGDGLVVTRHLLDAGCEVSVFMAAGTSQLSSDTQANLEILRRVGSDRLRFVDSQEGLAVCSVLIDALLGTGTHSPPRPPVDSVVAWVNSTDADRVALDIPTGLDGDSGQILGEAINANLTVTMGALKTGHLLGEGPSVTGTVTTVPIGIPGKILQAHASMDGCALLADDDFVRETLPRRSPGAHKYTSGPTLVVGGSPQYPGAPALAAHAAARVGSGYVVAALPSGVPWNGPTEIPTVTQTGEEFRHWVDRARAVLAGPGLGRGADAKALVLDVLSQTECPVVLDADSLRNLPQGFFPRSGPCILTPHMGEFRHLTGIAEVSNPVTAANKWAAKWNVTLMLKGSPTVIADPGGSVVIAQSVGTSVATAGTGDVLAGLCAGLLATGLPPFQAAVCAAHLSRAATQRYISTRGRDSMMASDIIRQLPLTLSERFQR